MDKLSEMQEHALNSTKHMTWENYERNLVDGLIEKIELVEKEKHL
jgi:hypothetical protein